MAEGAAKDLVGRVVNSMVGFAIKEINYMRKCSENVEKNRIEWQNLKVMRDQVQQQIEIANGQGNDLLIGVVGWVEKADFEISKAEQFLYEEANAKKTCFKIGLCGNWHTLYHYGKKATKNVSSLLEHQEGGKVYESCVSVDTPAPGPLLVYQNKNLDDIATQNSALGDIITAIEDEDESKQIIGIYGIGGVGKTTLAMEVSARVKHLFAAVAFTTVSQTLSVEKIQKDIGDATKRIMKGEKILIILDDVSEGLDRLVDLCIPCGRNHPNCKILLTSRSVNVCEKMNAHKICVNALPKEEAWVLFKRVVGEEVERETDLKQVAMKVAEECGGLPLLLNAVGNALKNKSIEDWEKALTRLQEHAPTRVYPEIGKALTRLQEHAPYGVDPEIEKAFTPLKLSYDLQYNEVKSCFLLCSMYPEGSEISLEHLAFCAVGLAKFHGLKSLEDARQRVDYAVKKLTSSGLLLNLDDERHTKMHKIVRDVALLIASEGDGKNKFLVEAGKGLTEWLPRKNDLESYTGISLMKNNISKLPNVKIHLPHLVIFLIQRNDELPMFSDELIRDMKEVRVLDMSWCKDQPLPRSFRFLTKLRMLYLQGNKSLNDISILAEMQDLEILIINKTGIKEIPQEIGRLVNLRRLEAIGCENLYHVAPGVISNLWRLEELLIGFMWVLEGIDERIVEIMNLPNLTYLALHVPRFDVIPEGFNPRKLKGYVIQIGGDIDIYSAANLRRRHLVINTDYVEIPFLKWIKQLTVSSNSIDLGSVENLKNILPQLYHEGFNELEHIGLESCPNVSCLVDTANWDQFHSSKRLGEGKIKEKLFGKLVTLDIRRCDKLVKVFPVSVAQWLVNLQNLSIGACGSLEEVIWDGDEETIKSETEHSEYNVFHSLANIFLYKLDRLERFYSGHSTINYPSLVDVKIWGCKSMKIWGLGIHKTPKLKFVKDVQLDGPEAINDAVKKIYEAKKKRRDELMKWALR